MAARVEPITASDAFAVTPSDATVFSPIPSALRVGTAGDLTVETLAGTTLEIANVVAGETIALRVRRVLAATTADDITAFVY